MFVGTLADKTHVYFQNELGMKFSEFNTLKKASTPYSNMEEVKKALGELRSSQPTVATPVTTKVEDSEPPPIPDTWTCTVTRLVLYRAVDLSPGKIKVKQRFSPRTNPILALPDAIKAILRAPRSFAEEHVRANKDFVHSAAIDETCAGYQSQREYVYRITIPTMYQFTPPPPSDPGRQVISLDPILWADTQNRDLRGATKIAFDPRKVTKEVDLIFDITLNMIDAYKKRGTNQWVTINWNSIQPER